MMAAASSLAAETDPMPLGSLGDRYEQSMTAGLYAEAADAAAEYITTLLADPDYDRLEWAGGLVRLGDAQRSSGDHEAAFGNYALAIDTYFDAGDRLDPLLIEPMFAAAESLIELGEFRGAADMLERVVHLEHVNYGPSTITQCEALQRLGDTYALLGRPDRALAQQRAITHVYHRNYPGDDVRKLPALLAEAELLRKLDMLVDSHATYRRAIAMVERADGTRSPHLLEAIYELAWLLAGNSIMDGYNGYTTARRFIQRAEYIADNGDDISAIERADAYIAIGDFLSIYTLDRAAAERRYRKAWTILAADEAFADALEQRFGEPQLLNEIPAGTSPIMKNLMQNLEQIGANPDAQVLVRFDIDAEGLPRDIEVVEGDPGSYWDDLIVDHVGKFRFRPQFDGGDAVTHEGMHWNVPYRLGSEAMAP